MLVKTVQVNFVVNTVLIQYYVYYEIYLNSLYFVDPVALTLDSTHNGLKSILISAFSRMQLKKSYEDKN